MYLVLGKAKNAIDSYYYFLLFIYFTIPVQEEAQ